MTTDHLGDPRGPFRGLPGRLRTEERGLVAGADALLFGVLIFVLGTIMVLNAWSIIDAKFATSAAAREAVRSVAEAPAGAPLELVAHQAAGRAFEGHGRPAQDLEVIWDGPGPGPVQARCAQVRYRVSTNVDLLLVPRFAGASAVEVVAAYSELIDPFRSGLMESHCER